MILFPPDGMSYEDAMHEAKKLITTGLVISLGVIYYIDKKKNDKAMKEALISDTNKKFDNLDALLLELRY